MGFAQSGVQFGSTAENEATVEKVSLLLNTPSLAGVDALCKQVAADGLNDALVRTKLYMLGQAVSAKGAASEHQPALEALYAKYAKESGSPVQQLFFIEQLRWIGTQRSLPVIKALCESEDVHVAASANMTRQSINRAFDPATLVYPKTKMRQLNEALAKADRSETFRLLSAAIMTKGDIRYQAFAVNKIGTTLSAKELKQWCDVTRKCEEPLVAALLIRALGSHKSPDVRELMFDMCGHEAAPVSAAALAVLAKSDPKTLQAALPSRLANVNQENYRSLGAFLASLSADVTVPALTKAYPEQGDLGKQVVLETLAAHPRSEVMVKAALEAVASADSDKNLAKAAFRYLRQSAGPGECDALLESLRTTEGSLQREAVQAYGLSARRSENEVYNRRLLAELRSQEREPTRSQFEAAAFSGSDELLAFVSPQSTTSGDALRALSRWRDGLAAPHLMMALAEKPADVLLMRGVRQQLQRTMADNADLRAGWKALAACGGISSEDLRKFALVINERANIALNRPVNTTRPPEGTHVPAQMVDGNTANGNGYWSSGSPVDITVDLESVRTVAAARLHFYTDGTRYYQHRIDTSVDNESWTLAVDKTKDTSISKPEGVLHSFEPRAARYVKLTVTKNSDNPSIHVNEMTIYSSTDIEMLDPEEAKRPSS